MERLPSVALVILAIVAGLMAGYILRGETHHYYHVTVTKTETISTPYTVTTSVTETATETITETVGIFSQELRLYSLPSVQVEVRVEDGFIVAYITNIGSTTLYNLKVAAFFDNARAFALVTLPSLEPGKTQRLPLLSMEPVGNVYIVVVQ